MSKSTVSLDDIRLFVEVAQVLSLSRASEQLGIPTSTLSRRLSLLEQQLGVKLLHRSTRTVQLTELGQGYYERCQQALEQLRYAQQELQDQRDELSGLIRVTMPTAFGITYLAPLFQRFQNIYKHIQLDLHLSSQNIDIIEQKIDLAIRFKNVQDERLVAKSIASIQRTLYASPDFIKQQGPFLHPQDIKPHHGIMMTADNDQHWTLSHNETQEHHNLVLDSTFKTNDISMAKRLCILGCGIALLSPPLVVEEVLHQQLQPLLSDWQVPAIPIHLVYAMRQQPLRIRVLMDYLQTALAGKMIT